MTGFFYPGGPGVEDIAISPFSDGGVLTTGGEFYSTLTGDFEDFDQNTGPTYTSGGELTFDAAGRPHIIDNQANVFSFDTIAGTWSATNLGLNSHNGTTTIAADSTGTVGAAFVDDNSDLIYAYWTNSAGWQSMIVAANVNTQAVGLAFDHDDLPVISYSDSGRLWVAYDPIVVPEPGSLVLLAGLGLAGVARRRRSA